MPKDNKNINTTTNSPALNTEDEKQEKTPALILDDEQQRRLGVCYQKARNAKDQRTQARDEFDGLDYESDYYANKNAANAYLWPKKNDDEVRVVTGTTEKKIEVLSNEIMSMNLQPEAVAYDEDDNELKGLGRDMIDIVKRTNDIENDEDFWQAHLRELLSQRAAFFQECDEYITINSRKDPNTPGKPLTFHRARKKLISGLRIYLGDINVPARDFQTDQPYIVVYSRYSYEQAKSIYQSWDRWEYVKAGQPNDPLAPFGYRMNNINDDEVEEIKIIDPLNDEYDIILNGVPMMVESTPLPYEVLPTRRFQYSMVVIKEMDTDFAYGKQPVSSAKTLQALNDEIIRNLVRKFRQALEPPLGVKNGMAVYSKDIWSAGSVTQGVSKEDFSVLNPDNKGVTQSEFSMYQLIENKTAEFIGAGALQQGMSESGEQTATEIQQLQRNAIKNLGHIVAAVMRAKRDAPYLRIYNILENFTKPTKRTFDPKQGIIHDVFRKFTIPTAQFEDGKRGKKIIQFSDKDITPIEQQAMFDFENREEQLGRPTRIRIINHKKLAAIKVFWHIVVNPQPREGSDLMKVLFKDKMQQAASITQLSQGQKTMNFDKVADDFEETWSATDWFTKAPQQNPNMQQQNDQLSKDIEAAERSLTGSQMTEGTRAPVQRPSLNELQTAQ